MPIPIALALYTGRTHPGFPFWIPGRSIVHPIRAKWRPSLFIFGPDRLTAAQVGPILASLGTQNREVLYLQMIPPHLRPFFSRYYWLNAGGDLPAVRFEAFSAGRCIGGTIGAKPGGW
jgi:hypothetical protein